MIDVEIDRQKENDSVREKERECEGVLCERGAETERDLPASIQFHFSYLLQSLFHFLLLILPVSLPFLMIGFIIPISFRLSSHLEKERENEENNKVGVELERTYLLLIEIGRAHV